MKSLPKDQITEDLASEFNIFLGHLKLFNSYANRYGKDRFIQAARAMEIEGEPSKNREHHQGVQCDERFAKHFRLFADLLQNEKEECITSLLSTLLSDEEPISIEAVRVLIKYMERA